MEYSIVVPVFRSSSALFELTEKLVDTMNLISNDFEILFVEDCGGDDSWKCIRTLSTQYPQVKGIRLSNNFGQLAAIKCGIDYAKGEYVITSDDDLEYDTKDIIKLINCVKSNDYYLVYAMPINEKYNTFLKRSALKIRNLIVFSVLGRNEGSSYRIFLRSVFQEFSKSHLHFEAWEKKMIADEFIGRIKVNKLVNGNIKSGYNFFKKVKVLNQYFIEYDVKSTFVIACWVVINVLVIVGMLMTVNIGNYSKILMLILFINIIFLILYIKILQKILMRIFFNTNNVKMYNVAEKTF